MAKKLMSIEDMKSFYAIKDYDTSALPTLNVLYADVLSRKLYYPNSQFSVGLLRLMGRKAFTQSELELLKTMGFNVEIGVRKIELPQM